MGSSHQLLPNGNLLFVQRLGYRAWLGRFLRKALTLQSKDSSGMSRCHQHCVINMDLATEKQGGGRVENLSKTSSSQLYGAEGSNGRELCAHKLALITLTTLALKCLTHGKHPFLNSLFIKIAVLQRVENTGGTVGDPALVERKNTVREQPSGEKESLSSIVCPFITRNTDFDL